VAVVRELLGIVTSERAQWGIVVTSGTFTDDAVQFATKNHIELIDGNKLERLIQSVQPTNSRAEPVAATVPAAALQTCPQCGSLMVLRTAKRGTNAGVPFLGCSKYPVCKGIRPG
jgi:restriction system protein